MKWYEKMNYECENSQCERDWEIIREVAQSAEKDIGLRERSDEDTQPQAD